MHLQVKRERETRAAQLMSGIPWETVTLTTLSRDRPLIPKLLSEARDLAMKGQEGKLVIHTAWGIEWRPFGLPRRKRPLKSVVLDQGVGEKVEEDVRAFLGRREWYADRGTSIFERLGNARGTDLYTFAIQAYHTGEDTCFTAHPALENHPSFKHSLAPLITIFVSSIFPNAVSRTTNSTTSCPMRPKGVLS